MNAHTAPGTDPTLTSVPAHDAIVLAGGRASRIGGDKPNVHVGGRRLLDHVLDATTAARHVVVVGPDDLVAPLQSTPDARVSATREDPPFGGPVAGVAAGLTRLADQAAHGAALPVLLLACDVPLAPGLVPELLAAWARTTQRTVAQLSTSPTESPDVDGICIESGGRVQWLVGIYDPAALQHALAAVAARSPAGSVDGASMKWLVEHLTILTIQDPEALSDDVDTWHDVERLDARLSHPRTPPGARPSE